VGSTGIMFLNEVALGKEKHVDTNQSHLKAAPAGYDCVIAQGNTEPGMFWWWCGCVLFVFLSPKNFGGGGVGGYRFTLVHLYVTPDV